MGAGTRNKGPPKDKDSKATASKFCSAKCRAHKPSTAPDSIDRRIEDAFLALLNGEDPPSASGSQENEGENDPQSKTHEAQSTAGKKPVGKKGDHRILVPCTQVEEIIYERVKDPEKVYGRRKNRLPRWMPEKEGEWRSVDMVSSDDFSDASTNDEKPSDDGILNSASTLDPSGSTFAKNPFKDKTNKDTETLGAENLSPTDEERPDRDSSMPSVVKGAQKSSIHSRSTITDPTSFTTQDPSSDKPTHEPSHGSVASGAVAVPASDKTTVSFSDSTHEIANNAQSSTPHVSEDNAKRREGERKAQERERVRCAARRAVIFGLVTGIQESSEKSSSGKGKKGKKGKRRGSISSDEDEEEDKGPKEVRRKCEAIMQGVVVEPSFAKGDWSVRWREE